MHMPGEAELLLRPEAVAVAEELRKQVRISLELEHGPDSGRRRLE